MNPPCVILLFFLFLEVTLFLCIVSAYRVSDSLAWRWGVSLRRTMGFLRGIASVSLLSRRPDRS